jgi:hypothetical protein
MVAHGAEFSPKKSQHIPISHGFKSWERPWQGEMSFKFPADYQIL